MFRGENIINENIIDVTDLAITQCLKPQKMEKARMEGEEEGGPPPYYCGLALQPGIDGWNGPLAEEKTRLINTSLFPAAQALEDMIQATPDESVRDQRCRSIARWMSVAKSLGFLIVRKYLTEEQKKRKVVLSRRCMLGTYQRTQATEDEQELIASYAVLAGALTLQVRDLGKDAGNKPFPGPGEEGAKLRFTQEEMLHVLQGTVDRECKRAMEDGAEAVTEEDKQQMIDEASLDPFRYLHAKREGDYAAVDLTNLWMFDEEGRLRRKQANEEQERKNNAAIQAEIALMMRAQSVGAQETLSYTEQRPRRAPAMDGRGSAIFAYVKRDGEVRGVELRSLLMWPTQSLQSQDQKLRINDLLGGGQKAALSGAVEGALLAEDVDEILTVLPHPKNSLISLLRARVAEETFRHFLGWCTLECATGHGGDLEQLRALDRFLDDAGNLRKDAGFGISRDLKVPKATAELMAQAATAWLTLLRERVRPGLPRGYFRGFDVRTMLTAWKEATTAVTVWKVRPASCIAGKVNRSGAEEVGNEEMLTKAAAFFGVLIDEEDIEYITKHVSERIPAQAFAKAIIPFLGFTVTRGSEELGKIMPAAETPPEEWRDLLVKQIRDFPRDVREVLEGIARNPPIQKDSREGPASRANPQSREDETGRNLPENPFREEDAEDIVVTDSEHYKTYEPSFHANEADDSTGRLMRKWGWAVAGPTLKEGGTALWWVTKSGEVELPPSSGQLKMHLRAPNNVCLHHMRYMSTSKGKPCLAGQACPRLHNILERTPEGNNFVDAIRPHIRHCQYGHVSNAHARMRAESHRKDSWPKQKNRKDSWDDTWEKKDSWNSSWQDWTKSTFPERAQDYRSSPQNRVQRVRFSSPPPSILKTREDPGSAQRRRREGDEREHGASSSSKRGREEDGGAHASKRRRSSR